MHALTWQADAEYQDHVIEKVEPKHRGYYGVTFDGGMSIGVPDAGFLPAVGQSIRLFGRGFGSPVRGIVIDGRVCYYRTPQEQERWHQEQAREARRKREVEFEEERASRDARYDALPAEFRARIDRFRVGAPNDFRIEYEPYELFCCEQAVVIAEQLRLRGKKPDTVSSTLNRFRDLSWKMQQQRVPGLSDGHSGNTFGMALRLAYWWAVNPEMVIKEHGAMVPLTGCKDYGCTHDEAQEGE